MGVRSNFRKILFAVGACAAMMLLWLAFRHVGERSAVQLLESVGATVYFDYQLERKAQSDIVKSLRRRFGRNLFAEPKSVYFSRPVSSTQFSRIAHLRGLVGVRAWHINDVDVAVLSRIHTLECLNLESPSVSNSALSTLSGIRELTLSGPSVKDSTLSSLSMFEDLVTLQLCHTTVTSNGLRHLRLLTSLQRLDILGGQQVDSDGLRHCRPLHNLKVVNLRSVGIGDDAASTISGWDRLVSLSIVDAPQFSDASVSELCNLNKLQRLVLIGTSVTDDSASHLTTIPTLLHLGVGPGLHESSAKLIQGKVPGCEIWFHEEDGVRIFPAPGGHRT